MLKLLVFLKNKKTALIEIHKISYNKLVKLLLIKKNYLNRKIYQINYL